MHSTMNDLPGPLESFRQSTEEEMIQLGENSLESEEC